MKVSKTDYIAQKNILNEYIGKEIRYQGNDCKLIDILDITLGLDGNISHYIECILFDKNGERYEVFIGEIFEENFPQYCEDWSKLPPFIRK